jgi:hypothetical protein
MLILALGIKEQPLHPAPAVSSNRPVINTRPRMSQQFRRTWQTHRVGQVLFTVQIDPHDGEFHIDRHRGLAELTRRLVNLFSANQVRATWAAGNPAKCAATSPVIGATVEHELAILGNAGWVGPTVGRMRFGQELGRRVSQASSMGISIRSFVPRVASVKEHVDLMLKQGITAVVGAPRMPQSQLSASPRAMHYGIWELPVTQSLPLPSTWWTNGVRSVLRRIRTVTQEAGIYHIVIDAAAIERGGNRSEATIGKIVRGVSELRTRGVVRVETLASAVARLADVPAAIPQRSILRQAA